MGCNAQHLPNDFERPGIRIRQRRRRIRHAVEDAQRAHQMAQVARASGAVRAGAQPATGEDGHIRENGKRDGGHTEDRARPGGLTGGTGVAEGGVLTASVDSAITHKAVVHVEPGLMLQRFDWCGKQMEVANVYAPTAGGARIDFFSRVLRKHLKVDTIVGGDFNCVSDPTLDVVSADPLSYSNGGARVLSEVMEGVQLVDERREQLGSEVETTRGSNTSNGYTSTRVDKWYLPQANKWLWTINTVNTFMFKQTASDHNGVMLKIEDRDGEIGHERVTINANIMRDPAVQDTIAEIANEVYRTHARKSESRKWRITEAAV